MQDPAGILIGHPGGPGAVRIPQGIGTIIKEKGQIEAISRPRLRIASRIWFIRSIDGFFSP